MSKDEHRIVTVFSSHLCTPDWRAWDCVGATEEELNVKCIAKYGRVPMDCKAVYVNLNYVPEPYRQQFLDEEKAATGI